ncbi:early nodulin-like protein 2 [Lactuca sativa]|uniref:early nodulin-like protein 2 n=1 Tax=Lactuca sativa TaxID=4236 RepID=UPI000CBEFBD5|nr:early nodulin-like protein 2 [Lactuca sativa]
MASQKSLCFLVALFISFICSSQAVTLEVGDDDGWTLNPVEDYNAWSGRLRFLVNDTLYFKYEDATDSVLVVDKDDYDNCNVDNAIEKLAGGESYFKLEQPGPHYFITGNKSNCDQGQKIIVAVLHIRTQSPSSPLRASSPLPPAPASPVTVTPPSATPVLTPPASTGGSSPSPAGSNLARVSSPRPSPSRSLASTVVSSSMTASLVTLIIALCLII